MENFHYKKRLGTNFLMEGLCWLSVAIALVPLFLILFHLIHLGFSSVNWDLFTKMPKPVGEVGGGMANAIVGSIMILSLATVLGIPIGLLGGLYLSEYPATRLGTIARFMADILNGTPSIVIGIFIYSIIVIPMHGYSALAGGVALGFMMIPIVMRTTEEMLKLVPHTLREGGMALGLPYWRVLFSIVLTTGRRGIVTGILLALSRVAGETAPLLFTTLGNQFWNTKLTQPTAAMPLQIFVYAISPYEDWQRMAWAAALVLIGLIILVNLSSRLFLRKSF